MTARRKIFRIEELVTPRREALSPPTRAAQDSGVMRGLSTPRTKTADVAFERATVATAPASQTYDFTRITAELSATVRDSEQATQKILAAAEDIDRAANNLSAALKNVSDQNLAQDICDRVIQIFEACNFQDVTSQRVTKVMAALAKIENRIAFPDTMSADEAPPLHGPRLASDAGHISQREIDTFFAEE
jgi:chemotaxis protein CheZ